MRNSLLAMLIAFGTTFAMPAIGAERYAFQPPETQQIQNRQMQEDATAGTTKAAPSETNGDLAAKYRSMMDSTAGTGPG